MKYLSIAFLIILFTNSNAQNSPDTDKDSIPDAEEIKLGTNPNNRDSDGDGTTDYHEISYGTNPLDANEKVIKIEYKKSSLSSRNANGLQHDPFGFHTVTYIKNGKEFKKESCVRGIPLDFLLNKGKFIHTTRENEMAASLAKKKADEDKLNRMEKECDRLLQESLKRPSQVNDAKYWQAHSEMINFRLKVYPGSISIGGGSSRIEELEDKVDHLQNTIDNLER